MQDTTRLLEMADFLDNLPNGRTAHAGDDAIDMSVWRCSTRSGKPGCGTVGCIAGHTVLRYENGHPKMPPSGWGARAAILLGFCTEDEYKTRLIGDRFLNYEALRRAGVAHELFHPGALPSDVIDIDGSQCATVMRAIAAKADTIKVAEVAELWEQARQ